MIVKDIIDEDFANYKVPSMFIITSKCDFKCCIEAGNNICQNMDVVKQPNIEIDNDILVERYLANSITKAIVIAGLEPFDTFDDLLEFIRCVRLIHDCHDDIVIYTGYYPEEIKKELDFISYDNIIVKFGRFIPDQKEHFDEVLGVNLASNNQYAERIS